MSVLEWADLDDGSVGEACLSEDGTYRYSLIRRWNKDLPYLCFIMLNPSTADHKTDDPTITRCIVRARRWRWRGVPFGGICVLNLFALRATKPGELRTHPDPVGPENDECLAGIARSTDSGRGTPVIAAWGAHGPLYGRSAAVRRLLAGTELWCLGTCTGGEPWHPLMVAYDILPVRYAA